MRCIAPPVAGKLHQIDAIPNFDRYIQTERKRYCSLRIYLVRAINGFKRFDCFKTRVEMEITKIITDSIQGCYS